MTRMLALLLMLSFSVSGFAAERAAGMSERVLKVIEEAQVLVDAENYVAAETTLRELLERRLSGYERAQVNNVLGYVLWQQEKWQLAEETYQEGLQQKGLPDSLRAVLTATLARLALVNQDYNLAESRLLALLNIPEQDTPEHRMLLAMAYVGAEQWSQALEAATAAIDARAAAGLLPVENWLLLLASIHYSLDDPGAMRDVMAEIVLLWPREKHLMNLAALHGQLGDPDRQLALVEAMIDEGRVLQQQNLVLLSGLFLSQGLPFKAAVLLETHLDDGSIEARQEHLERLSQAWFLAAEPQKAIPPLEQAAAMADNGELYMRVARLYLDNQDWQAADQAAAAALERGGLAAEGEAWLLRGMAMAGLEKYADARRHFERAMAEDDSARFAEQWLLYIEREQERAEMLSVEGGV